MLGYVLPLGSLSKTCSVLRAFSVCTVLIAPPGSKALPGGEGVDFYVLDANFQNMFLSEHTSLSFQDVIPTFELRGSYSYQSPIPSFDSTSWHDSSNTSIAVGEQVLDPSSP